MSFTSEIKALLEEGYSYDNILNTFLEESDPSMQNEIQSLQNEGYSSEDMVSTLLEDEPQETLEAPQDIGSQAVRGTTEGTFDLANLASLAQAGLQSPLTYGLLTPEQREIEATPGALARAQMETDPNLSEMDFIALAGDDEFMSTPILPGQRRKAEKEMEGAIPKGGALQEGIRRAVHTAPLLAFGPGAAATGLASEFTGQAAAAVTKAFGGGETAQLVADILGGFYGAGKYQKLVQGTKKIAPKIPRIAREAETKLAKAEIVSNPKKVQKEISELSSNAIKQYENKVGTLSEDSFTKTNFNARKIEDSLMKEIKDAPLDAFSPKTKTSEEAWNLISENVNKNLSQQRTQYRNLYTSAEKGAKDIFHNFSKTTSTARNTLSKLGKITTKGKGQAEVEKALGTTITDLTAQQKRATDLVNVLEKSNHPKAGKVAEDLSKMMRTNKSISVDKAMALKRNLNDIINYGDLSPSIKDLLRPIVKTLKSETLEALNQRPAIKAAYQKAESSFAKTANTFDKDAINFLRAKDASETASQRFLVGSNLKSLKESLKGSAEAWGTVEGQILREIAKKSVDTGRDILKEVSPYLSSGAKKMANDLIGMGDKLTSSGAQNIMRGKLLENLQRAATTGERPDFALKMMQNPSSYSQVKSTLSRSPKGKEMWKALQSQSIEDMFQSMTNKNGGIDWSKAKDLLKSPQAKKIIRDAVGKEGLEFFETLSRQGDNITRNLEAFATKNPSSLVNKVFNATSYGFKSLFWKLLGGYPGLGAYIGLKAITKAGKPLYYKMLANPGIRNGFKKLILPKNWKPEVIEPIIQKLNENVVSENKD